MYGCPVCDSNCFLEPGAHQRFIQAHQPVYTLQELEQQIKDCPDISGPDTALCWWQYYRVQKDYAAADKIRSKAVQLNLTLSFKGTHYEALAIKKFAH